MIACYMTNCPRPVTKTREGHALCLRHYNQAYIGGWSVEAMAQVFSRTCQMRGCVAEATTLDHDHACCENGRFRKKRCGTCNRGFLCATCNRQVGMVERETSLHTTRIPGPQLAAIRDYLAPQTGHEQKETAWTRAT